MKTRKLEINKEIIKVASYTLMILCAIIFTCFPKSYPKYIDIDYDNLIYNDFLYTLYKGESYGMEIIKEGSTNLLAHLEFSFDRNDVVKDNTKDTYIIKLPENSEGEQVCYFADEGITPSAAATLQGNNSIFYKSTKSGINIVNMYCYVDKILDEENKLNVSVNIEEQVGEGTNLEQVFLYKKILLAPISKNEYYNLIDYKEIPEEYDYYTLRIPRGETVLNRNQMFDDWIKKFSEKYTSDMKPYGTEIVTDYVASEYKENGVYKDITSSSIKLNGLTMEYDSATDEYVYRIRKNFVGYARTYKNFTTFNSGNMYFSCDADEIEDGKNVVETAITYYLENYYFKNNKDELLNYINLKGGVSALFNKQIPGTLVYKDNEEAEEINDSNLVIVQFSSNILDYTYIPSLEEQLHVGIDFRGSMYNYFINNLGGPTGYYRDIISSECVTAIDNLTTDEIYDSVIKNHLSTEGEKLDMYSFTDYFTIYDSVNDYYVIIKIFSDIEKDRTHEYNTVELSSLRVPSKDFKIEFTNTNDTTLKVSMEYTDKDSIIEVIDYLEVFFKEEINISENDLTADANGKINVNFNITKHIER